MTCVTNVTDIWQLKKIRIEAYNLSGGDDIDNVLCWYSNNGIGVGEQLIGVSTLVQLSM